MHFPVEGLDLTPYIRGTIDPSRLPLYDLFGVSQHMGGLNGGHYTAICQNAIDKEWYVIFPLLCSFSHLYIKYLLSSVSSVTFIHLLLCFFAFESLMYKSTRWPSLSCALSVFIKVQFQRFLCFSCLSVRDCLRRGIRALLPPPRLLPRCRSSLSLSSGSTKTWGRRKWWYHWGLCHGS